MHPPAKVQNKAKWIVDCTKIHARALEFIEGRSNLFETSDALIRLTLQTHLLEDPDLLLFGSVHRAFLGLPVGSERVYWDAVALAEEDIKIKHVEAQWLEEARGAASRLVANYAWSLEARAALRHAGGVARDI